MGRLLVPSQSRDKSSAVSLRAPLTREFLASLPKDQVENLSPAARWDLEDALAKFEARDTLAKAEAEAQAAAPAKAAAGVRDAAR